jgi:hypothetical protein
MAMITDRSLRSRTILCLIAIVLGAVFLGGGITPLSAKELLLKVGDLQVPAGTAVYGDAIAVGGTAYVDGTVEGDAVAVGGSVEVRGRVGGSVRAAGGNVMLYSTAIVDGDATAVGGTVQREPGASVGGRRSMPSPPSGFPWFPGPVPPWHEAPFPPGPWWFPGVLAGAFFIFKSLFWLVHLGLLVMFVGTAWLLAVLFPRGLTRLAAVLERDPGMAIGAGLLGWPLAVMIAAVLIVSIVGLTLVLLVPIALLAAMQFGTTAVALIVGQRIRPSGPVQEVIIGAVILAIAFSIPGLGGLVGLAVATWGLGAVILLLAEGRRFQQPPPASQPPSPQQAQGPTATI